MHNYSVYKKANKNKIWGELNLSGSKVKNWILTPSEFIKNEPVNFNEIAKQKVEVGNLIEGFIFDYAKSKYKDFEFIKDKMTYKSNDFDFCFANVDGFLKDKDQTKWLLEIKNTEIEDIKELAEIYKYQILYYCWFFNLTKARLVAFVKGCYLKFYDFDFNEADIEFMNKQVLNFKKYLEDKQLPADRQVWEIENIDQQLEAAIRFFNGGDYKTLKALAVLEDNARKILKKYLIINNKERLNTKHFIFKTYESKGRTTLDREKIQRLLDVNNLKIEDYEKTSEASILLKVIDRKGE